MPAWGMDNEMTSIELRGDLRKTGIRTIVTKNGRKSYEIELETTGRWSENETHEFRPDAPFELERAQVKTAQTLLVLHYNKGLVSEDEFVDIRLVLIPTGEEDDKIMNRIGYLKTRYTEVRDLVAINEDLW